MTCIMDHHSGIVWRGFGYVCMVGRVGSVCSFLRQLGFDVFWDFQLLVVALVFLCCGFGVFLASGF